MSNFLKRFWMCDLEVLRVMFAIVEAEIGRYCKRFPLRSAEYRSRSAKLGSSQPLAGAQTLWLRRGAL